MSDLVFVPDPPENSGKYIRKRRERRDYADEPNKRNTPYPHTKRKARWVF